MIQIDNMRNGIPPSATSRENLVLRGELAHSSVADIYPPSEVSDRYGLDARRYDLDIERLHQYRAARLHAEMDRYDSDALLLFDPVNIRYATGARNMQIWTMRNPARYCVVLREGKIVLFEMGGRAHHAHGLPMIDEVRVARPWFYYYSGPSATSHVTEFAAEVADLVTRPERRVSKPLRLAVDRCDTQGARALERQGLTLLDGQKLMEQARRIKSEDEVAAIRMAIDVCEAGIERIKNAARAGVTELSLWSKLHQTNIELGGEYIETRLLTSGLRTNPWHQEASQKRLCTGELVSFDTDLIGPLGYGADLSGAFVCGDDAPSADQKNLYQRAYDQIMFNTELLQVGAPFSEITERAQRLPKEYHQWHRVAHGNGMSIGEFPAIGRRPGYTNGSIHEGYIEEGMVLCVGTFAGRIDGGEGVKLEHQLVIRADGPQLLSRSLFDPEFCT